MVSRIILSPDVVRRGVSIHRPLAWDDAPYYFRERFRSSEAGATVGGKGARPGPGSLVATESDGSWSIDSSGLVLAAQSSPAYGDLSLASSVSVPRAAAPAAIAKLTMSEGVCEFGLYTSTTLTAANRAHVMRWNPLAGNGESLVETPAGVIMSLGEGYFSPIAFCVVADPSGGAAYLMALPPDVLDALGVGFTGPRNGDNAWFLLGREYVGTGGPLYAGISNYTGVGSAGELSLVDTSYNFSADEAVSSPSKSTEYGLGTVLVADVAVALSAGWANGQSAEFRFVLDGTSDYVAVRVYKESGTTKIRTFYNDGTDTPFNSAQNTTIAAGDSFRLQAAIGIGTDAVFGRTMTTLGAYVLTNQAIQDEVVWQANATGYFTLEGSATVSFSDLRIYESVAPEISTRL